MRFNNLRIKEVDINRNNEALKIIFFAKFKKYKDDNREVVLKGRDMLSTQKTIEVYIYDRTNNTYDKATQREREYVVSYIIKRNLKLFEMNT